MGSVVSTYVNSWNFSCVYKCMIFSWKDTDLTKIPFLASDRCYSNVYYGVFV